MSGCPFHAANSQVAPDVQRGTSGDDDFLQEAHAKDLDLAATRRAVLDSARRRGAPAPLTEHELVVAGRIAWRNHARCIGRLYWRTLEVRDRRELTEPEAIAGELTRHLRDAQNGGNIRSLLTVFAPPERVDQRGPRIWNPQLCGYAGYHLTHGQKLGDPRHAALTLRAMELGWTPPSIRTGFDLLPWILSGPDGEPRLFPVPDGLIQEVAIEHPEIPCIAEMGMRWYAVPAVANMRFRVAGTDFSAAPFNGWYMGTEIAARNLTDPDRYDLLPELARRLGLDTRRSRSLWKDRALVELNRAVLHSYERAGVKLVDHHTASEEFMRFLCLEEKAGRAVSARWDWIVPPLSPATLRVFHTPMKEMPRSPEFLPALPDAQGAG